VFDRRADLNDRRTTFSLPKRVAPRSLPSKDGERQPLSPERDTIHRFYFRSLALGLVALCAAACDGQQDESYGGEALAEIRGQVSKDPSSTATNVKALIIWNNFAKNGDTFTSVEAPISGSFPARFTPRWRATRASPSAACSRFVRRQESRRRGDSHSAT
jgi:hypothetical protein